MRANILAPSILVLAAVLAGCGDREPRPQVVAPAPEVGARGNPSQDIDPLRRHVPITAEITPRRWPRWRIRPAPCRAYPMQPPTIRTASTATGRPQFQPLHAVPCAQQRGPVPGARGQRHHYMDRNQFLPRSAAYFAQCHVVQAEPPWDNVEDTTPAPGRTPRGAGRGRCVPGRGRPASAAVTPARHLAWVSPRFLAGIVFWGGQYRAGGDQHRAFCVSCHEMRDNVFENQDRSTATVPACAPPARLPRAARLTDKIARKMQASKGLGQDLRHHQHPREVPRRAPGAGHPRVDPAQGQRFARVPQLPRLRLDGPDPAGEPGGPHPPHLPGDRAGDLHRLPQGHRPPPAAHGRHPPGRAGRARGRASPAPVPEGAGARLASPAGRP